jgi:hypothetical protein
LESKEQRAGLADAPVPYLARGTYRIDKKHYFKQNHAKVRCFRRKASFGRHTSFLQVMCASLHRSKAMNLLVVGFESGTRSAC